MGTGPSLDMRIEQVPIELQDKILSFRFSPEVPKMLAKLPFSFRELIRNHPRSSIFRIAVLREYRRSGNKYLIDTALRYGATIRNIDWMFSIGLLARNAVTSAIKSGIEDTVRWLLRNWHYPTDASMKIAIDTESPQMIYALCERNRAFMNPRVFEYAASRGALTCMQALYDLGRPWDEYTFMAAVKSGNVDSVDWLCNVNCPYHSEAIFTAIDKKDLTMIRTILSHPQAALTLVYAINDHDYGAIDLLLEHKCPVSSLAMTRAVSSGDLDLTKTLHRHGGPLAPETFEAAVAFGQLDVLQCIYDMKCPIPPIAMQTAINNRMTVIIEWLFAVHAPVDSQSARIAASHGDIKLITRLRDAGCKLTSDVFAAAAVGGQFEMMEILYEFKCPMSTDVFTDAVRHGNHKHITWLHERKCPMGPAAITVAVEQNNHKQLDQLLCLGCPYDQSAYIAALLDEDFKMLDMLHKEGNQASITIPRNVAETSDKTREWVKKHKYRLARNIHIDYEDDFDRRDLYY